MIIATKEERAFLNKVLPNADKLLLSEDIDDILDPLDEWIAVEGLNDNDELTDEGRQAQRIYDNLYMNN